MSRAVQDDAAIARENFRAGLDSEVSQMRVPLHECVEQLHAAGYVVLGPENAEEAAQLLGWLAFPEKLAALEELDLPRRATDVLAAFPDSFTSQTESSRPRPA